MNREQLIYLIEVYKVGSISKAAKNCFVSIPAISQAISNLEKKLDIKIFERSRAGTIPTKEGIKIIKKAYEIVTKFDELEEITKTNNSLIQGSLKIAASPSMIILVFKTAFVFKKDYPNVDIKITEETAGEIINTLKLDKNDIGFLLINEDLLDESEDWQYETLINDKMYLCVGRDSPLAKKKYINPRDLLNQQLVTYSGVNSKIIVNKFLEKNSKMNILFESNEFEIIKKTISEGFAVGFLNGLLLRNEPRVLSGELIPLPLNNFEYMEISYGWLRVKNTYFSPVAKKFSEYLREQIKLGDY